MIDIYLTSFYRKDMTEKTVNSIHERTTPGTFQLHIFDNGSDKETRDYLYSLLVTKRIASLHLDSRNTGFLYNKLVYHAMTESSNPYYVVSDNDILPPKLEPDWLSQMIGVMDRHPHMAFLTPQLPPVFLQMPLDIDNEVVYCGAVGNTFKLVRREAFHIDNVRQRLDEVGDDNILSQVMRESGWRVGFCRNIYCYHIGQCPSWGYTQEQILMDRRRPEYGKPYMYDPLNTDTFEPPNCLKASELCVNCQKFCPKCRMESVRVEDTPQYSKIFDA
jgi:cellulose synthase/poly-beta-1,6-N-acetylglucosamine synthase-like glycosyltransferase